MPLHYQEITIGHNK